MNEEQIRDEARKAANRSQFMSNHIYDHKSYEDGFYEGMNQALRQYGVLQRSEQLISLLEKLLENNMCSHAGDELIEQMLKEINCA